MFAGVYAGRRVFVTGHTGFKGSWLTSWLLDLGAHVTGYALDPPTVPNLFEAIGLDQGFSSDGRLTDLRADVRDAERLSAALMEAAPEVVFHLAAQPLVRRSYAEPHLTLETNVMGTANLLEAVRTAAAAGHAPRAVVVVTSDKCYENLETDHAYVEGDALGGWDLYSASKACTEIVCGAYRRSFFLGTDAPRLATVRAGNVIGGGDWGVDRLVPDCVRAFAEGREVELRNPASVRPWQHVLEPLSGYLCLAAALTAGAPFGTDERAADGLAWNFGPGARGRRTAREVVDLFSKAWGSGGWTRSTDAREQPHEAGLLELDSTKAERDLGWRPVWVPSGAVEATALWYHAHAAGQNAEALRQRARDDIASYARDAAAGGLSWAVS